MRVLLTEGSGLTSRQVATRLGELGHEVELLSSTALCLARFTRYVRRVHRVPPFGREPFAWLDAALSVAKRRQVDLLFPTQEQVTVLSAFRARVPVPTLVPPFSALLRVQDKVSAFRALGELGLAQPPARVVSREADVGAVGRFPVFLKRPISTASTGVRRAVDAEELRRALAELGSADGDLLLQEAAPGDLAMVQAIADQGELVAVHACRRAREGVGGGASSKESLRDPRIQADVQRLVAGLGWHGPISLDAILTPNGPVYIDVNPRLVEPGNALIAGVDLVGLAVALAMGRHPGRQPLGRAGVRTHQLLLAELRAAQQSRRAVVRELVQATAHAGPYANSVEELTPVHRDLRAAFPATAVALATLVSPGSWSFFSGASVDAYAISPSGWSEIQVAARVPPMG
jgi:predicted ATP-grasp superfamily ATP-dependent carboligase